MSRMQKHLDAIQRQPTVDLPGSLWREGAQFILMSLLLPTTMAMAATATSWYKQLGGGLFALLALLGMGWFGWRMLTIRRAIRITPQGLAERTDRPIPWHMTVGAMTGKETSSDGEKRILVGLTEEGMDWALEHDVLIHSVDTPYRLDGVEFPIVAGCSRQETAELLGTAIRVNRHRLGLPPAG